MRTREKEHEKGEKTIWLLALEGVSDYIGGKKQTPPWIAVDLMGTQKRESKDFENRQDSDNPCLRCGACCVVFRASFYWAEADDATENGVPVDLTVKLNPFRRAMRKVGRHDERGIALRGAPGRSVYCEIYDRRPSTCRNFEPSWRSGEHQSRCEKARKALRSKRQGGYDAP